MKAGRPASSDPESVLSRVRAAAEAHRAAAGLERDALEARNDAIISAVRAGARLEEIGQAASLTRAAVSLVARDRLPARSGRGGPYARRRGTGKALDVVCDSARVLATARAARRRAQRERDSAVALAVAEGVGVSVTARATGLTPSAVSAIARGSASSDATHTP